ncbi:MAG: hypothetical protein LHV68_11980 [Elusimicrobia bacterium]|nr:hypothetical protein [Candidatus Liberimonas magnetica]
MKLREISKAIKVFLVFLAFSSPAMGFEPWNVDFETGLVTAGYNDIQVPGNIGTRFSLTDSFSVARKGFYRVRLTRELKKDKFISFLYAPLTLSASGVTGSLISFNNDTIPANTDVSAKYRFDSYRVSFWKLWKKSDDLSVKLGFTAKVRDASITLTGAGLTSEKKNTGFVPLLNFGLDYRLSKQLAFIFDADALAGGPGRAEDVLVAAQYRTGSRTSIKAGYRIVEGGADVTEVYNFALLNYWLIGFSYSF